MSLPVLKTPALPSLTQRSAAPHRIILVSTALGVGGGAEEQVMLLALGLRRRGWAVKIVSLLPLFPISAELEASDIPISSLGMKRGIPDPRAMRALIREIRQFQPHIVHGHMPQANLLARSVRPFHSFPVLVCTLHNLTMERINGSSGRFLERAHRWTDRFCDVTTVICRPAVKSYVDRGAVPAGKIEVFHNGVNTRNFEPDSAARAECRRELGIEGKFVWLAIGRFELAKDYPNMIRAFSQVVGQVPQDTMLLICGRGSLDSSIKSLVASEGLQDRVRFLGVRRDIPRVMNAADGFVLSSYLEGLPMVLLQAASVGLPMVATDVGGNAEVVVDSVNGLIVPIRNHEALGAALRRIQHLPANERTLMSERGRQWAREQFEMERILDRWEALYISRFTGLNKNGK